MMKVLLADDEYLTREGMRDTIKWVQHGMEVVGTAEDGEQALAMVREHHPDLIITDIGMPFMNGLQLAETVLEERPQTSIVLLTCYDEFDYAKQAVKLGVVDYVVKPIELNYMEKLLDEIADKHQKQKQKFQMEERTRLFTEVLHRHSGLQIEETAFEQAGLTPNSYYSCIMADILGYSYAKDILFNERELQDYFSQFAAQLLVCARDIVVFSEESAAEGRVVLIVNGENAQQAAMRMQHICSTLRDNAALTNEYSFLCATDGVSKSIWALQQAYEHCQTVMHYKFLNDEITFLDYTDLKRVQQDDGAWISADIAGFVDCVRTFDRRLIEQRVHEIMNRIRESGRYSFIYGQMFIASAYSQLTGALKEVKIDLSEVFNDPLEEYQKVIMAGSLQKQIQDLGEMLAGVCDYVQGKKGVASHVMVEKARQYINLHFMEYDISLQCVSKAVNMSSCYFSLLFKQESGQSFVSYLTDLRIEKAKYLLQYTDQKAYEIAFAIGYDNPSYFSTLFKKNTGLSAKEYRQQFNNSKKN